MNQKTWILILAQALSKGFTQMTDEGGGGDRKEAAALAAVQQQQALLAYKLIFNQTFDCLNKNQDFKICVPAKLRLYRKYKSKGRNTQESRERRVTTKTIQEVHPP